MPKEEKIIYEPHPVSAERKAELRAKGFKIIDARFAPTGSKPAAPEEPAPPAGNQNPQDNGTEANSAPPAAEVLALVDGNFMAFKSAAKKLLGDATPGKKDEIIAALKALPAE